MAVALVEVLVAAEPVVAVEAQCNGNIISKS
jgi:hypothetical protein